MDPDVDIIEKWDRVVGAIDNATRDAFPASPPFDPSNPSTFQTYWHNVFSHVQDAVASDTSIPEFLTEPPVRRFTVSFFDGKHGLGCPCCLPEVDYGIDLQNDGGVTKNDLMRAFIEHVYGEETPQIYAQEDGEPIDCGGVLVYTADWMSSGRNDDGGKIAYGSMFEPEDQIACIFMYCCAPERYAENKKDGEPEARL
ncbi:hypothetical protein ACO1O0_007833 [Amphichorda felina]